MVQADESAPINEPSLGRFLYTQNPFYLISCGFVLYGLFVATASMGDQLTKANFLTGSLAGYAAIMALTAFCVIRLARVWDDARTILLVVVIALVACSVAVDELCVSDTTQAAKLIGLASIAAILISEFVLRSCGIRFAFWYRAAYYGFLAVFFAAPLVAGRFRAISRELSNWSPLLFSIAVAGAMLLLIPAVRRGKSMAEDNGTPWQWPLYPLSLFVVLAVIGAMRSHAIWMAFGSLKGDVVFEPLLLMPLVLAVLVLYVEAAVAANKRGRAAFVVWAAALLLLCGVTSLAKRPSPFHEAIATYGGSTMTIAIAMLIVFYLYAALRRVPGATHALPLAMFWLAVVGKQPSGLAQHSVEIWMVAVAACAVGFIVSLVRSSDESLWLMFTIMTAAAILMLGYRHHEIDFSCFASVSWTLLMFMFLGAIFDSWLAGELRRVAGIGLMVVSFAAMLWTIIRQSGMMPIYGLAPVAVLAVAYLILLRRRNWIFVAAFCTVCAVAAFGHRVSLEFGIHLLSTNYWQLKLGFVFFGVGALITSSKAGIYQRRQADVENFGSRWGILDGF